MILNNFKKRYFITVKMARKRRMSAKQKAALAKARRKWQHMSKQARKRARRK
jgi:hypothetical protein